MAKIKLQRGGFTPIPEGDVTMTVAQADYKEDFGKIEIHFVTDGGEKHIERFSLTRDNGELNQGALTAFSIFVHEVTGDESIEEIDVEELVGLRINATVRHESVQSKNDPERTMTFVRLDDISPVGGGGVSTPDDAEDEVNLDNIFG